MLVLSALPAAPSWLRLVRHVPTVEQSGVTQVRMSIVARNELGLEAEEAIAIAVDGARLVAPVPLVSAPARPPSEIPSAPARLA